MGGLDRLEDGGAPGKAMGTRRSDSNTERDENASVRFYATLLSLAGADESRQTYRRKVIGLIQELTGRLRARAKTTTEITGFHPSSHIIAVLTYRVNSEHVIKVRDIQRGLGFTAGGVTRRLDSMVRDGLIVREPDPEDGRALLARLTPAGVELAELLLKDADDTGRRIEDSLTLKEWKTLLDLLLRLGAEID
jgi:DNA-binding MarR family transcriptional regulator